MITINGDRGLVRIETWEEIERTPGFARDVDHKTSKLDSIIGSYRLPDFVVCGLASCHHKHFRGYLVATKDRRITNIGKDCGKTHFGVDFEAMTRLFDRDMHDKERRESLHSFKSRLDDYIATVEQLKNEPRGGAWLNRLMTDLKHPDRGLPDAILRVLRNMIATKSFTLKTQRLATAREIELMRETGQLAPEKPNQAQRTDVRSESRVIEEEIGTLSGVRVLYPDNDIREILIKDIDVGLKDFRSVDVDTATRSELGRWAKWVGELDGKLNACREIVDAGRAFFDPENIAKLAEITESEPDESQVMAFARKCSSPK